MLTVKDIMDFTETLAPLSTAAEWDNAGLNVGAPDRVVSTVLLALDITPAVVAEARTRGAELIISHHPVIFDPLASLSPDTAPYLLAQYDIAALCLHTNLDRAARGVNTALAQAIGLSDIRLYPDDFIAVGTPEQSTDSDTFASLLKLRLSAPSVRYTTGSVSRVAVSSGGGGEGIGLYRKYGFDAFVTGELKHHQYLYAVEHRIAAFDAGHYSTEHLILKWLMRELTGALPGIRVLLSEQDPCPYHSI